MRAASIRLCSPRLAVGVSGPTMLALDARPENAVRLSSVRLAADVSGLTMLALNGQPENAGIEPRSSPAGSRPTLDWAEEQAGGGSPGLRRLRLSASIEADGAAAALRGSAWLG